MSLPPDAQKRNIGDSAEIPLLSSPHKKRSLFIMSDDAPAAPSADPSGTPHSSNGAPSAPVEATPKRYVSSLEGPHGEQPTELPAEFAEAILELEKLLKMPVWLFVQDGGAHELCNHVEEVFFGARDQLPQGQPIALLIESPGGNAAAAYGVARLLQRRCGRFTAVVANWAKSAATLLALGASRIVLAEHGQLGPLDMQIYDPGREEQNSALNETQALERLHAVGLEALVNTIFTLKGALVDPGFPGVTKKFETLLPHAIKFVAESMRPLYEKVDVVQYTARLRDLKIAEEYAVRLLEPNYSWKKAKNLARELVERYPDHGFVIDFGEAKNLGIRVVEPTPEQAIQLDKILQQLPGMNAFGRVVEA